MILPYFVPNDIAGDIALIYQRYRRCISVLLPMHIKPHYQTMHYRFITAAYWLAYVRPMLIALFIAYLLPHNISQLIATAY
jgi:hypothetical protein